jgi:putative ABC transport system permease protein
MNDTKRSLPPSWVESLLRRVLPRGESGLAILGDLREEFAQRRNRNRVTSHIWYLSQAVTIAVLVTAEPVVQAFRDRFTGRRGGRKQEKTTGANMITSFLRDTLYSVRTLARAPVFALVAIVTLALGAGASTAIFSVLNGVILAPLPYHAPERLVDISVNTGGAGWYGSSVPEFLDYEDQLTTVESLGGYVTGTSTVGDSTMPRRISLAFVTDAVFPTLGVPPVHGRFFTREEGTPGGPAVVMVSHGFWEESMGGDPSVLGRTLTVAGRDFEIIGVMPDSMGFPSPQTELWMPFGLNRENPNPRSNHFVNVVARLRTGATLEQARNELAALAARSVEQYPENYSGRGYRTRVISLRESIVGGSTTMIFVVFGAVILVLLIASVNVAGLVVSRGETRRREVAIRTALGANRSRLTRLLMSESVLIALGGGTVGVALAWIGVRALVAAAPPGVPRLDNIDVDIASLLFGLAVVASAVAFFGLWPALRSTGGDVSGPLTDSSRSTLSRSARAVRRILVVSEVALAAALTVGAGTLLRTLQNLYEVDSGFSADNVLTFRLDPSSARYPTAPERVAFYTELSERLAAMPGVLHVGAAARLPLNNTFSQWSLVLEGQPVSGIGDAPDGYAQVATPGYFSAMGIRARRGRLFDERDNEEAMLVAVVNQTMANTFWPGDDAIGKRFRMFDEGWPFIEIIGIIPDVKEMRLDQPPEPRFYVPYAQSATSAYFAPLGLYVTMKTERDPTALVTRARSVLAEVDPTVPMSRITTMEGLVRSSVASRRYAMILLQILSGIAVFLACIGVYGVLAMSVAQTVPEIGLRKALGAENQVLLRSVLRESLTLSVAGAIIGIPVGVALTRVMGSFVFEVGPFDLPTLGGVAGILTVTALLASLIPANRASRVDPVVALKAGG